MKGEFTWHNNSGEIVEKTNEFDDRDEKLRASLGYFSRRYSQKLNQNGEVMYAEFLGEIIKCVWKDNAWVHDVNWDGIME
jgi:hypothetical protein